MVDASITSSRVARFDSLQPIMKNEVPAKVADMIWSQHKLLPVVTRAERTINAFGNTAPITGAGDISITLAVCPPGTGARFHIHNATFETFTVMKGKVEFRVANDVGGDQEIIELNRFDTLSVPPRVYRGFTAIGSEEAVMQVIITGGAHEANDIFYPAALAEDIAAVDPDQFQKLASRGIRFEKREA